MSITDAILHNMVEEHGYHRTHAAIQNLYDEGHIGELEARLLTDRLNHWSEFEYGFKLV